MKIKFILFVAVAAIACACQKSLDTDQDVDQRAESLKSMDVLSIDGIRCENGCMHFPSASVCMDVLNSISSRDSLTAFEQKYNFTSLRSFNDRLIDELSECETPEEYESLWETCTDYLKYEDDRVMPRVTSAAYAGIANIDGVFYVGNVKHMVVDDVVIVEDLNNTTRSDSPRIIDYVMPCNINTRANGEVSQRYTDERYETNSYKVFSRTNMLRSVVVENIDGTLWYHNSFGVQVHVSGQKKKTLIGWNSYKDRFFIENLHFDVSVGNQRIRFLNYRNGYSFSEYGGDIYKTEAVGERAISASAILPMPPEFHCIVHRARSRSLGNCGALTDKNICMSSIYVPLSQCVE